METAGSRKAKDEVSVIGRAVVIVGEVSCDLDLQIEGHVTGDVRCPTLLLSEGGKITGSIHAERVRISGTIDGAVEAGDLALEATAYIEGDVTYTRLKVTPGGKIRGRLQPRDEVAAAGDPTLLKLVEPTPKDPPEPIRVFGD